MTVSNTDGIAPINPMSISGLAKLLSTMAPAMIPVKMVYTVPITIDQSIIRVADFDGRQMYLGQQ